MQSKSTPLSIMSAPHLEMAINLINRHYSTNIRFARFGYSLEKNISMLYNEMERMNLDIQDIERKINTKIKESMLTKEEVESYFGDDRFCNFCWSMFLVITNQNKDRNTTKITRQMGINLSLKLRPLFGDRFKENGLNITQRKMNFIDCLQYSDSSKDDKKTIMDSFNEIWLKSLGRTINLSWINKDSTEQTKWCYEYMLNSGIIKEIFTPTEQDYFWALAAAIDLSLNPNDLELLIIKMKKAFSQRKYREKNHELKTYSIGMNQSTKEKLDELVKSNNTKIHLLIEELINKEHMYYFKK